VTSVLRLRVALSSLRARGLSTGQHIGWTVCWLALHLLGRAGRRRALAVAAVGLILTGRARAEQLGYIANGEGSVSVFDTATDKVIKTIPVPVESPFATLSLLLSPRDRLLFVLVKDRPFATSVPGAGRTSLAVIDTTSHRVTATTAFKPPTALVAGPITELEELALSADGTRLYVGTPLPADAPFQDPRRSGVMLSTLDPIDLHEVSAIPVVLSGSSQQFSPVLSPDRGRLYIVNEDGNLVVVDATTGAIVTEVALPADIARLPASGRPLPLRGMVLSPSQTTLAVRDAVVDLETNRLVGRVFTPSGTDPPVMSFSGDGATLFALMRAFRSTMPEPLRPGCSIPADVTDLTLLALDVSTVQSFASMPLGSANGAELPRMSSTLDGHGMAVVVQPARDACRGDAQELVLASVPKGAVTGRIRELGAADAAIAEIAQSPDGRTTVFGESALVVRTNGRELQRQFESRLLEIDLQGGTLVRRVDLGDFTPASSGSGSRSRPGVFTRDGQKLFLVGKRGILGAAEVEVLASGSSLRTVQGGGLRPQEIVLGESCPNPEGCVCQADVDCDDGDRCTVDSCEGALGCRNERRRCIDGLRCLSEDERADGCLNPHQRRRLDRVRRTLRTAGTALGRGDYDRARELLRKTDRDVKEILATTIKLTNVAPGSPPPSQSTFDCNVFVFRREVRLLRALRDVRSDLTDCPRSVP